MSPLDGSPRTGVPSNRGTGVTSGALGAARSLPIDAVGRPGPAGRVTPGPVGVGLAGLPPATGPLTRAIDRWRRAVAPDRDPPAPRAPVAPESDTLTALARRLDDSGCSYGRVSAARLEQLTHAYDRLETKLNAVLMTVIGTFMSTLAGVILYYVRGGAQ